VIRLRLHRPPRLALGLSFGALVALAAIQPVAGQDTPTDRLAKLDQYNRAAVELMLDSAATLGLPVSYLRSIAYEGIQRHADGRAIVRVVRKQFDLLKTARATLGAVDSEELGAAAAVLGAGARPNQLATFRAQQKAPSRLEAFAVWADLLTRGVPAEDAFSGLSKLWSDGADDATFLRLWKNVQSDILQGLNPGTALQNRIRETPVRAAPQTIKPPEGQQENQSSR
jgi:hypothetical protein